MVLFFADSGRELRKFAVISCDQSPKVIDWHPRSLNIVYTALSTEMKPGLPLMSGFMLVATLPGQKLMTSIVSFSSKLNYSAMAEVNYFVAQ